LEARDRSRIPTYLGLQVNTHQKSLNYIILQVDKIKIHYIIVYMGAPLTKKITDHSTLEVFSFSFFCDNCEKEWKSPSALFESGSLTSIEHEEARKIIWAQEHKIAFEKANLEAHFHFNCCPDCKSWVCDECFNTEEKENFGRCKKC